MHGVVLRSKMDGSENTKRLTNDEKGRLKAQNSRLVPEHKANMLEINAQKHWDMFYKRNETKFFKDRHWTTREFRNLIDVNPNGKQKVIFEVGCGVGNLIFPLIEEGLNYFFLACDFSPRAIEFVKRHKLYDEKYVKAFQADVTSEKLFDHIAHDSVDVATLVFVLSAIHPDKFATALSNVFKILKPGGVLLFRDYGLHDMAQIRFKPGHKIGENFYMRQDGTRSYYFSVEFVQNLFKGAGFGVVENGYVHRRTVNKKENVDVPRVFVQAKLEKPI